MIIASWGAEELLLHRYTLLVRRSVARSGRRQPCLTSASNARRWLVTSPVSTTPRTRHSIRSTRHSIPRRSKRLQALDGEEKNGDAAATREAAATATFGKVAPGAVVAAKT